jgi:hypothetical protein
VKRVTYKQLHQEVVRVFGEHTDEPIHWVTGPHGPFDVHLVIAPGGDEQSFEMRFTAHPDRAAAKSLALATLQRMQ